MRVSDNSPLIAARSKKHLDIVSELLKHGPDDVNSIDCDNSQVLESASGLTSWSVNELLERKVDVNKTGYSQPIKLMPTRDIH